MKVNIVMVAETIPWLVLRAVATFALLTLLYPFLSAANAADGEKWKNLGRRSVRSLAGGSVSQDPPLAIDGFNMPPTVKEHFKTELGATCKGGKDTRFCHMRLLEQMWSGPARHKGPHLMNRAAVEELPVAKSPDGRPYRKGSVVEAAKTFKWTFVHEGKTYVLHLPTSASTGAGPMVLRRSRS